MIKRSGSWVVGNNRRYFTGSNFIFVTMWKENTWFKLGSMWRYFIALRVRDIMENEQWRCTLIEERKFPLTEGETPEKDKPNYPLHQRAQSIMLMVLTLELRFEELKCQQERRKDAETLIISQGEQKNFRWTTLPKTRLWLSLNRSTRREICTSSDGVNLQHISKVWDLLRGPESGIETELCSRWNRTHTKNSPGIEKQSWDKGWMANSHP